MFLNLQFEIFPASLSYPEQIASPMFLARVGSLSTGAMLSGLVACACIGDGAAQAGIKIKAKNAAPANCIVLISFLLSDIM